jgi:hypothetical protein
MRSILRYLALSLGAFAVFGLLAFAALRPATAAPLTGGNFTYLVGGEEVTFTFDPVSRRDGLLLPLEVFQRFQISVEGGTGRNPVLSRQGVRIQLSLGSTVAVVDGREKQMAPAPLRLNGRLFLPAGLLPEFGIDYVLDGTYLSLRDLADGVDLSSRVAYDQEKARHNFTVNLRSDQPPTLMTGEFTLLNRDLVVSPSFHPSFGLRVRLLRLLETHTLIQVRLRNDVNDADRVFRSLGWAPQSLFLVDDQRNQYDFTGEVIEVNGLVTTRIAPRAEKSSVLVFPKLQSDWQFIRVFYDPNSGEVGSFTR